MELHPYKYEATPLRSAAKAIVWRMVAGLDTVLLSWLITGNMAMAGSIAGAEIITKMFIYYAHERAWAWVSWGHMEPKKDETKC